MVLKTVGKGLKKQTIFFTKSVRQVFEKVDSAIPNSLSLPTGRRRLPSFLFSTPSILRFLHPSSSSCCQKPLLQLQTGCGGGQDAGPKQGLARCWSYYVRTHEVYEPLLPPPPFPGNPRGLNATAEEEEGEDREIRHVCCRNSIPVLLSHIFLFWTSANPSSCPAKLILRHTRTV